LLPHRGKSSRCLLNGMNFFGSRWKSAHEPAKSDFCGDQICEHQILFAGARLLPPLSAFHMITEVASPPLGHFFGACSHGEFCFLSFFFFFLSSFYFLSTPSNSSPSFLFFLGFDFCLLLSLFALNFCLLFLFLSISFSFSISISISFSFPFSFSFSFSLLHRHGLMTRQPHDVGPSSASLLPDPTLHYSGEVRKVSFRTALTQPPDFIFHVWSRGHER